jgi:hypothetical protein
MLVPNIVWRLKVRPAQLRGRAPNILGPRAFGSLAHVELDAVTLAQIFESLTIDRALMEEVFLSRIVLDKPKSFVDS